MTRAAGNEIPVRGQELLQDAGEHLLDMEAKLSAWCMPVSSLGQIQVGVAVCQNGLSLNHATHSFQTGQPWPCLRCAVILLRFRRS
jgi:hypothetical protein